MLKVLLRLFLYPLTIPFTIISGVREGRSRVRREKALGELNELLEIGAITEMEYDKAKRDLSGLPAKNIALHQQILARICSIRHLEKEIQKEAAFIFNEINDLPENHNKTSFFQNLETREKQIAEDIERAQQVLDAKERIERAQQILERVDPSWNDIIDADIESIGDFTLKHSEIELTNAEKKLKQFTKVLNELDDDENKAIMREGIEELTTTIAGLKARIAEESTDETEREITEADIDSIDDPTMEAKPFPLKQQLTKAENDLISYTEILNELNDDDEHKAMFRESVEELTTTIADLKARIVEVPTEETLKDYYTQYGIDSSISIIDRIKNKIKNITESLNYLTHGGDRFVDGKFFYYYNNDWHDNEERNPLSPENWPLGWGVEGEGSQVCVNIATFNESKLDDVMFAITHIHGERTYPSTKPRGVLGSVGDFRGNAIANESLTSQFEETVNQLKAELKIAKTKNKQIIAENEELKKENELIEKLYLDGQKKQKRSDLAKNKGVKGVTNFMNHVAKPQYKIYCEKTIKTPSINATEHLGKFLTDKECMKNIEDEMKYTMGEEKINMEMPKKPKDKNLWENSAWINMQRQVLEELEIKKIGQSSKRK